MDTRYINSAIFAALLIGALYIGYQFEQDYKWNAFMQCVEKQGDIKICNIINFRDTSVYAPTT